MLLCRWPHLEIKGGPDDSSAKKSVVFHKRALLSTSRILALKRCNIGVTLH